VSVPAGPTVLAGPQVAVGRRCGGGRV